MVAYVYLIALLENWLKLMLIMMVSTYLIGKYIFLLAQRTGLFTRAKRWRRNTCKTFGKCKMGYVLESSLFSCSCINVLHDVPIIIESYCTLLLRSVRKCLLISHNKNQYENVFVMCILRKTVCSYVLNSLHPDIPL